jgi:hypothetical protein
MPGLSKSVFQQSVRASPRALGVRKKGGQALTRRIKIVLLLVLVLERWGWAGEVLEYCAKSELHLATARLGMLKARKSEVGLCSPLCEERPAVDFRDRFIF